MIDQAYFLDEMWKNSLFDGFYDQVIVDVDWISAKSFLLMAPGNWQM